MSLPPCRPPPVTVEPGPDCQVTIYSSCGMKYYKHTGSPVSGVALRADPAFGESQRPAFDYVAVGCAAVCGAAHQRAAVLTVEVERALAPRRPRPLAAGAGVVQPGGPGSHHRARVPAARPHPGRLFLLQPLRALSRPRVPLASRPLLCPRRRARRSRTLLPTRNASAQLCCTM